MEQNLSQLGRDIGRTVQKVLSDQNFAELKNTIENVVVRQTSAAVNYVNQAFANQAVKGSADRSQRPVPPAGDHANSSRPRQAPGQAAPSSRVSPLWMRLPSVRRREKGWGMAAMLSGIVCAVPTGLIGLLGVPISLSEGDFAAALTFAVTTLIPCVVWVVLAIYGKRRLLRFRRFERYLQMFENRSYCQVSRLAVAINKSEEYVVRDLNAMVKARMFLEGYFDESKSTFMTDMQSYRQYLELRQNIQQNEEKRRSQSEMDRALSDVRSYLERLHQLNIQLPMEEITRQLDGLEKIISRIFDYVSDHPEKLPDIRQFGAYYLPTTVKLVEAYQELEEHQMRTAAINQTKLEILEALENINRSFQVLFDQLLEDDLLDVSTDISALKAMLAQEGLSGNGLFDKQDGNKS